MIVSITLKTARIHEIQVSFSRQRLSDKWRSLVAAIARLCSTSTFGDVETCCRIMPVSAAWLPHCVQLVRIGAQHSATHRQHRAVALQCSVILWGCGSRCSWFRRALCKAAGMVRVSALKSPSSILPNSIRLNVSRKLAWVMS